MLAQRDLVRAPAEPRPVFPAVRFVDCPGAEPLFGRGVRPVVSTRPNPSGLRLREGGTFDPWPSTHVRGLLAVSAQLTEDSMAVQVSLSTVDQLAEKLRRSPAARQAVVVGVGSGDADGSRAAAEWGAREAQSRDTDLYIVSAYHRKVSAAEGTDDTIESELRFVAERAVDAATELAAAAAPGLEVSGEIIEGATPDVLRQLSANAGVLVLGARHLSALNRAILGSVGTSVAAAATCPVVVVMGSPGSEAGPGDVVVGVSLDESATPVLEFAFSYAERHKLALRPVLAIRTGHLDFSAATVESIKVQHELDDIVARVGKDYPDVEVQTEVRVHRPVDALLTEALEQNLLVLGRREPYNHPSRHPMSVSMRVLHHATCPVAIVPYPGERESPATTT